MHDEYDAPWKDISESLFPDMLALLFPKVHADIVWEWGWESLDKDLTKLLPDSETGSRWADKLFRVYRRPAVWEWLRNRGDVSAGEQLVHLNVEFQNQHKTDLELRVFQVAYRVFDRYNEPVVSLVVLGDDRPSWRPWRYGWKLWGFDIGIRFPSAKLVKYASPWRWRKLEKLAKTNPFAVVVMAHLQAQSTRQDPDGRFRAKLGLIRRLYESGYERGEIESLFRFIDWVMWLPEAYEEKLGIELEQLETETKMAYVTSWERMGIRKGLQQGLEEGRKKGKEEGIRVGVQKGILRGKAALLKHLLVRRFGELPSWAEERLEAAEAMQLERWSDRILDAACLADVFAGDDEPQGT